MRLVRTLLLSMAVMLITQFLLASCAVGVQTYAYSFSFDSSGDARVYGKPEVEVLDYSFGNSGELGTRPERNQKTIHDTFPASNVYGPMPRAEYLYVKWKLKSSGQEYEKKILLADRLPADPTGYGIHFLIDSDQIFVFLIPPPGVWSRSIFYKDDEVHRAYRKAHQIYPAS